LALLAYFSRYIRMAFSSGAIDLKTVCDAYGVSPNMGALRGKIYYSSTGTATTIPASGAIVLGDFRGNTSVTPSTTYFFRRTYANPEIPSYNVNFIENGVQVGVCPISTGYFDTYTITNGKLTNLNLNLYSITWNTNSSGNVTTFNNNFANYYCDIFLDNILYGRLNGTFTPYNLASSEIVININISVSNSVSLVIIRGRGTLPRAYTSQFNYNVTATGLQLVSIAGNYEGTYLA